VQIAVLEQRANIKFCFKPSKTTTETFHLIKLAYRDNALSRSVLMVSEFELKTGVRIFRMTQEAESFNLSKWRHNRKCPWNCDVRSSWALRMVSEESNINKETFRHTLHKELRKRGMCEKFVPPRLTDEQKQRQGFIQTCQDNFMFSLSHSVFTKVKTPSKEWGYQVTKTLRRTGRLN
jgi:hypothetical protein